MSKKLKTEQQSQKPKTAKCEKAVGLRHGLGATGKTLPPLQTEYTCTMAMFNGFPARIFFKKIVLDKPRAFSNTRKCTIISNEGKLLTCIEFDPVKKAKMLEIMKEKKLKLWQWDKIKAELELQGYLPKPEEYL